MTRTETALAPLIRNAEATLVEYQMDRASVPVIVPDPRPSLPHRGRCWTTCLESAAVGFVMDEWRAKKNPGGLLSAVGHGISGVMSCGPWRRAVQVGSLPFSTTVRCGNTGETMWRILPELRREMPERPFAVRNVLKADLPAQLPEDAVLLPVRAVYVQDFADGRPPRSKHYRRDFRLLERAGLQQLEDKDFDEKRVDELLALYQQLYRNRYSIRHPDFTLEMIRLARSRGWLELGGLADPVTGRLLGCFALHVAGRVVTTPIFGHDLRMPVTEGLYRQLSTVVTDLAVKMRAYENTSSGAGEFKRRRAFKPELEYLMMMPPLGGPRRTGDRAFLKACAAMMRKITVDDFLAAGG
ncbi:MAG: GNAT family N-acetyltransferase [Luteolibacter sp.]